METASNANEEVRSLRPRILVADDHPLVLECVVALLQTQFDVVGTARNGEEMVAETMRLNPEVIITDITMPQLDGIAAVRQLRALGCKAKVVFLTVHSSDEFVDACLAEGALGYVVKVHLRTALIPAIHAALSGRRSVSFLK
jgi:DNA-binding NarL/FixJ family response regulator